MGLDLGLIDKNRDYSDAEEMERLDNEEEYVSKYDEEDITGTSMRYSGFTTLRLMFIRATIEYVKHNETLFKDKILKKLDNWISPADRAVESLLDMKEMINFDNIPWCHTKLNSIYYSRNYLIGLHKFVMHSDYDGFLSAGDCFDIVEMFNAVCTFVSYSEEYEKEWINEVIMFFKTALKYKTGVIFL